MAFTPEQKAAIRKRALELTAQGVSEGEAARTAVTEIVGFPESPAFQAATGFKPFSPSLDTSKEKVIKETRQFDVLSISPEEDAYVRSRASQIAPLIESDVRKKNISDFNKKIEDIQKTGKSRDEAVRQASLDLPGYKTADDVAENLARKELERFREPVPSGFGTIEERKEESPLISAMETVLPDREVKTVGAPDGDKKYIDYDKLKLAFLEAYGDDDKAKVNDVIESLRTNLIIPKASALIRGGMEENLAYAEALSKSIAIIEDADKRIADKSTYLTDKASLQKSADPLIKTFSRQIEIGEGVPNLTEEQARYYRDVEAKRIDRIVSKEVEKAKKEGKTKTIYILNDGKILEASQYDPQIDGKKLKEQKQVPLTEDDIKRSLAARGEVTAVPWWADPEKKKEAISNPEKFERAGLTPYGSKKESVGSWLLRSALIVPNAIAGAASEIAAKTSPELATGREERREAADMPSGLKGAVLTNIKENRGYMGEVGEALDIKGIDSETSPGLYYGAMIGGFALDLLDPSIDFLKGAATGAKAGTNTYKALGKIYNDATKVSKLSEAAKVAAKVGYRDFQNSSIIANVLPKGDAGDIRGLIGRSLTDDYASAITAEALAAEGRSLDDINRALGDAGLSNSRWSKTFIKESANGGAASDVLARIGDNFGQSSRGDLQKIASTLAGSGATIGSGIIRRKDLGRIIGAIAKSDDGAEEFIRNVQIKSGEPNIDQWAKALLSSDKYRDPFIKAIAANKASIDVAKATSNVETFDNIVAITENTWAGKGAAKKILDRAGASDLGKIAKELSKENPVLTAVREKIKVAPFKPDAEGAVKKTTEAKIVPAFNLKPDQVASLERIANELSSFNKISSEELTTILARLGTGKITAGDLRSLISANLDLIAEGMSASGKTSGIVRARDLARTPISSQMALSEPLEIRTLNKKVLRNVAESLNLADKIKGTLSPGQRSLILEASSRLAALEEALIRDLKSGMNNDEFRELYGINTSDKSQILSHLIVGPSEGQPLLKVPKLTELLTDSLNDLFFTKFTKENIFDVITGTSVTTASRPLSPKGMEEISKLIDDAAKVVAENPSSYFDELSKLASKVNEWISEGKKQFLAFEPSEIISTLKDEKLPVQAQIAAYYRSAAKAIEDELITTLLQKEVGKGSLSVDNIFDPNFIQRNNLRTDWPIYVKEAAKKLLSGKPIGSDAISSAAADVARGILRNAEISGTPISLQKVDSIFNQVSKNPTTRANLSILFGENVASQIIESFASGYNKIRADLVNSYLKSFTERGTSSKALDFAKTIYEGLSSLMYTVLLNLRPRFHGANLLTGMDIAFGTTGRIINPLDVIEAVTVLRSGNPAKVMFTDAAGRSWTKGELSNILKDLTGQSVFGLNLPGAEVDRIIRLLESKGTPARELWDMFKTLPQSEDLMFRYAILKKALKEGRSKADAVALAKASMFDSGKLTDFEKKVKNIFLFYGFQRNNILNALNNMTSIEGIKKIGKVARIRENLSDLLVGEEVEEYSPSYAQTRILLNRIGFDPEASKDLLFASPSLATLDGIYALAELIKLEPSGIFGSAVRPEYKALVGLEDSFDPEFKKVPPEHVALLQSLWEANEGAPALDVLNAIVKGLGGDEIVPVPVPADRSAIEGAVGGFIYPLDTPKQRAAYKKFYNVLSAVGISTLASDAMRTIGTEGTKTSMLSIPQRIGFGTAALTPMTYISPEKQAYYDRLSRFKELQAAVKDIQKSEMKAIKETLTPEEKQKGEKIQQSFDKRKEKMSKSEYLSKMQRLGKELRDAKMKGLSNENLEVKRIKADIKETKELYNLSKETKE